MKSRMFILFTLILATAFTNQDFDENTTKNDDPAGHNTKANLNQDELINLKNA